VLKAVQLTFYPSFLAESQQIGSPPPSPQSPQSPQSPSSSGLEDPPADFSLDSLVREVQDLSVQAPLTPTLTPIHAVLTPIHAI